MTFVPVGPVTINPPAFLKNSKELFSAKNRSSVERDASAVRSVAGDIQAPAAVIDGLEAGLPDPFRPGQKRRRPRFRHVVSFMIQ